MNNAIRKGDLYIVLPFNERGSKRRAVVVSSDEVNRNSDRVSVAYLSTKRTAQEGRTHARLHSSGRPSFAILECVTTIPKTRLGDQIGHITLEEGVAIDSALCVAFDL